jgi:hypothetical protein
VVDIQRRFAIGGDDASVTQKGPSHGYASPYGAFT